MGPPQNNLRKGGQVLPIDRQPVRQEGPEEPHEARVKRKLKEAREAIGVAKNSQATYHQDATAVVDRTSEALDSAEHWAKHFTCTIM